MAWNEPGGNNDKDPWGNDQGPPDLDEAFRKFKAKFSGNKGKGGNDNGRPGADLPELGGGFILGIIAIVLVLWAAIGIYQVDEQEQAVVLRFGKYHDTVGAGLHWNAPLIDRVQKINVTKVRSSRTQGLMLTEDDNIVNVSLSVQYTVQNPKAFLLEVREPERSLQQATESALRHVIGSSTLHEVLTEGRIAISTEVHERLQRYTDLYHTGILVAAVNIEDAQPPAEVQASFDDVIRAKEDEVRVVNQAMSYRNGLIPEARGLAQRQIEEANAYKSRIVAAAEGEASRFSQLLTEYQKAPAVTRERLYIETLQQVLGSTSKVMVDVDSGSLLYLPLDKLTGAGNRNTGESLALPEPGSTSLPAPLRSSNRTSTREGGR
ncbi:MAG TPA: FtsH protease activity modulator HflK [Pseudomonadales bacterium]